MKFFVVFAACLVLASALPRPDVSQYSNVPADFNQANYVAQVPLDGVVSKTTVTQTRFGGGSEFGSGSNQFGVSQGLSSGGSFSSGSSGSSSGSSSGFSSGGAQTYSVGGGSSGSYSSGSAGGGGGFVQGIDASYGLAQATGSSFELLDAKTLATIQARFSDNDKYTNIQTEYITQAPIVSKHFYALAAPADDEIEAKQTIRLPAPQKQYKVIFIKAPSGPNLRAGAQAPAVQNEEKTIIYVLAKKQEDYSADLAVQAAPLKANKPEVYFIRYKGQKGAADAIQNIQNQYASGSSAGASGASFQQAGRFGADDDSSSQVISTKTVTTTSGGSSSGSGLSGSSFVSGGPSSSSFVVGGPSSVETTRTFTSTSVDDGSNFGSISGFGGELGGSGSSISGTKTYVSTNYGSNENYGE